jgi:hypothetical protein
MGRLRRRRRRLQRLRRLRGATGTAMRRLQLLLAAAVMTVGWRLQRQRLQRQRLQRQRLQRRRLRVQQAVTVSLVQQARGPLVASAAAESVGLAW